VAVNYNLSHSLPYLGTIVSLKETKINGQAVDNYNKRQLDDVPLSFTKGTVPASTVGFFEIFATSRQQNFLTVLFLGPAFSLMPTKTDHERTSKETEFDLQVKVGGSVVMFTTRKTTFHKKSNGKNVEAINVCYIRDDYIDSQEKVSSSPIWPI
jgi:hypothetical protein